LVRTYAPDEAAEDSLGNGGRGFAPSSALRTGTGADRGWRFGVIRGSASSWRFENAQQYGRHVLSGNRVRLRGLRESELESALPRWGGGMSGTGPPRPAGHADVITNGGGRGLSTDERRFCCILGYAPRVLPDHGSHSNEQGDGGSSEVAFVTRRWVCRDGARWLHLCRAAPSYDSCDNFDQRCATFSLERAGHAHD
jgi:hypothetical protein